MSFAQADIEARAAALGINVHSQLTPDLRVRIEANMIAAAAPGAGAPAADMDRIAAALEAIAKALGDANANAAKGVAAEASVAATLAAQEVRRAAETAPTS
jgi:hypothetical protein